MNTTVPCKCHTINVNAISLMERTIASCFIFINKSEKRDTQLIATLNNKRALYFESIVCYNYASCNSSTNNNNQQQPTTARQSSERQKARATNRLIAIFTRLFVYLSLLSRWNAISFRCNFAICSRERQRQQQPRQITTITEYRDNSESVWI